VPLVLQFNKRDLSDANITLMPLEQMQQDLNKQLKVPWVPASALTGNGVGKTLNACLKLLLKSIQKELNLDG
jgi:signal recognition particle receptor subunit beta